MYCENEILSENNPNTNTKFEPNLRSNPTSTINKQKMRFLQRLKSNTNIGSMKERENENIANKEVDLEDNGVFIGEAKLVIHQDSESKIN
jgi:hypothetical protein